MTARASMSALIARTRDLINDPAGDTQTWSDDQIQDVLDAGRTDYRFLQLRPAFTTVNGVLEYLDFYAPVGDWEEDYTFCRWYTTPVTPSAAEPISGHFTFATSTLSPVYITGKSYDLYRAAADLLEREAAQWVKAYAMTANGQSLQRNQVYQNMLALARSYRGKARARVVKMRGCGPGDPGSGSGQRNPLRPIPIDYGV